MDIKLVDKNKDASQMVFLLKGTNVGFVNALRRLVLESVPTLAVEDIVFKRNDSVLYDEIIANRLGLVPLVTDLKSYVLQSQCDCEGEGCAQCSVSFTLAKEGPCIVYSGDMKFADPAVKPVHDNIPIVKLLEGQDIEMEGVAVLGRGREHVKWSPGHCFHRNMSKIEIKGDVEEPEKVAAKFPGDVVKVKSGKLVVDEDRLPHYTLAYLGDELGDNIKISVKDDEFVFEIETWKQLQIKEIMQKAFGEMDYSLDEFSKQLKEL